MPLPPDVEDRINRNWESIPTDVQDRLKAAGFVWSGPTTTTTTTPGLGTTAAEIAGGTAGALLASPTTPVLGPYGPAVGAGLGTAAGRTVADLYSGRRPSLMRTGEKFAQGAGSELGGSVAFRVIGGAAKAGIIKAGDYWPAFARLSERIMPGIRKMGPRAEQAISRVASPSGTPRVAGERVTGSVDQSFGEWRKGVDKLFSDVQDLAGPEEVVPIAPLKAKWQEVIRERLGMPIGPPRGTGRMAPLFRDKTVQETGELLDPVRRATAPGEVVEGEIVPGPDQLQSPARQALPNPTPGPVGVPEDQLPAEYVQQAIATYSPHLRQTLVDIQAQMERTHLDFATARRLESQLGRIAYRGRVGRIANPEQRDAARMLDALQQGFDEFFDTDAGEAVRPVLRQAKDVYKEGRQLFQDRLRNFGKKAPETLLQHTFGSGKVETMLSLKRALADDPGAFDEFVSTHLDTLRKASRTPSGGFDPVGFAGRITKLEDTGQLEHMVSPDNRRALLSIRDEYQQMGPHGAGPIGKAAGTLGGAGLAGLGLYEGQRGFQDVHRPTWPQVAGAVGTLGLLTPAGRRVGAAAIPQMIAHSDPFGMARRAYMAILGNP